MLNGLSWTQPDKHHGRKASRGSKQRLVISEAGGGRGAGDRRGTEDRSIKFYTAQCDYRLQQPMDNGKRDDKKPQTQSSDKEMVALGTQLSQDVCQS